MIEIEKLNKKLKEWRFLAILSSCLVICIVIGGMILVEYKHPNQDPTSFRDDSKWNDNEEIVIGKDIINEINDNTTFKEILQKLRESDSFD